MRDAAARLQFCGAQGPRSRPPPAARSLSPAAARPATHVAARQHLVGPGGLGGFISRRDRSMRTGGGAGRPRGRPLPRYILPNSQSLLHRLSGARAPPLARSRAGAPSPPRDRPGPAWPALRPPFSCGDRDTPLRCGTRPSNVAAALGDLHSCGTPMSASPSLADGGKEKAGKDGCAVPSGA